jgi:hypothetical protein
VWLVDVLFLASNHGGGGDVYVHLLAAAVAWNTGTLFQNWTLFFQTLFSPEIYRAHCPFSDNGGLQYL